MLIQLATTGDDYEVFFTQREEIRNSNGDWVPGGSIFRGKVGPNDLDTLTGSSIDIAGVYGPQAGTLQLDFLLNLESVDFDYADGVSLTFPAGVTILSAPTSLEAGNGTVSIEIITYGDSTVVNLGDVTHPYTGNGPFTGGETWSFLVAAQLPLTVNWHIYDDGYGGGPVDALGATTVTEVGNATRLAKYWNLMDVSTDEVKLLNQSVVNGVDIYPPRDDSPTLIGNDAAPIVDGFQIYLNVNYAAPLSFFDFKLNGESIPIVEKAPGVPAQRWTNDFWSFTDFTYFGDSNRHI